MNFASRGFAMSIEINGKTHSQQPRPGPMPQKLFLREPRAFSASRKACDAGDCGACTVLIDGEPVHSLSESRRFAPRATPSPPSRALAGESHGPSDATGFSSTRRPFNADFCTAGMIHDLRLAETRRSGRILAWRLKGNICRCTGYRAIEDAPRWQSTISRRAAAGEAFRAAACPAPAGPPES